MLFQKPFYTIGIGMWLALIMAFNVWFIIWPNQQKALGLVPSAPEEKAAAARLAGMTSRINTMLSKPPDQKWEAASLLTTAPLARTTKILPLSASRVGPPAFRR